MGAKQLREEIVHRQVLAYRKIAAGGRPQEHSWGKTGDFLCRDPRHAARAQAL
jgi:hypothetical protein